MKARKIAEKGPSINLSPKSIWNQTTNFMSRLPNVNIDFSAFEKGTVSTKELIGSFLDGFYLNKHNIIDEEGSAICFDLMICGNPLDEVKKQEFYTFFSKEQVYLQKCLLAKIYECYLTKRSNLNIDTMLQICYSQHEDAKDGVLLKFEEKGTSLRKIGGFIKKTQGIQYGFLSNDILSKCLEAISYSCKIPINPRQPCFLMIDSDKVIANLSDKRILLAIENIEKVIDEYTNNQDESPSEYTNVVDAFLCLNKNQEGPKITKKDIIKNLLRISVINQLAVPGIKYLYFIPIPFPSDKKQSNQIGHFTLSTTENLDPDQINQFKMLAFVLMFPLAQANSTVLYLNSIRKYKVKATVAAIMARNLSHNYGSHVLNHLLLAVLGTFLLKKYDESPYKYKYRGPEQKDKIKETFQQIIGLVKEFFDNINSGVDALDNATLKNNITNARPHLQKALNLMTNVIGMGEFTNETLRQIVYLLNHIKCRVDYISEVSFGAPKTQTSRWVYGDIFKELDRVVLLMNHISGLEEKFQYEIEIRNPQGETVNESNDLQVAIPNDVVGTHALYNILENVIRNTAKHSNTPENNTVVFYLDFSDVSVEKLKDDDPLKSEAKRYYCVEIYDSVVMAKAEAKKLVEAQNKWLNEPVFDGDQPRSQALGLVEMEASAAYLRKLDSSAIDDESFHVSQDLNLYNDREDHQFNLLKAFMKEAEDKSGYYFGYRFFMLRPCEVLLVGGPKEFQQPDNGVLSINQDVFKTTLEAGEVFNYDFVVYFDEEVEKIINVHKTALSPRLLKLEMNDIDGFKAGKIKNLCWKKWWEQIKECKQETIEKIHCDIGAVNGDEAIYLRHIESDQADNIFKNNKYVEALSSIALAKLPGFNKVSGLSGYSSMLETTEGTPSTNCYRNLEAINNKILVVDERIQDAAQHHIVFKHKLREHYAKMNITVPDVPDPNKPDPDKTAINLLAKNFIPIADNILNYINEKSKSHDFVLIHYGILERVFKAKHHNGWKTEMDSYLEELSNKSRVVITSGRGVPEKLPPYVGFVSLSSVTSALIDYKSKYLINGLMYAARKSK